MITVYVRDSEMMVIRVLGGLRSIISRAAGITDRKMGPQPALSIDEDGMMAEYALCKHFNAFPDLAPSPRVGSYDLMYGGKRIDVKSTRHVDGRLLATLKDNPDVDVYVLAIIDGQTVSFPGYATKADLCREENIVDLGHGKSYAMSQIHLRQWK